MTRQILTSIKVDKELSYKLGILAEKEQRTKLDELRFLISEREKQLDGGSKKK